MLSILFVAILSILPLEDIAYLIPDYAQPRYSNSGESLAYLAPDERGAYNIYIDGKCLTKEKRAITSFFWEIDDQHLLYLYDEKGDENDHLYRIDLDGYSEDLTPFSNVRVELLGLSRKFPKKAAIRMNLRDARYLQDYQIDLETKEINPLLPEDSYREHILVGEELTPLAGIHFLPNGEKYLEVYKEGRWRPIWKLDPDDWYPAILGFHLNREKLLVLSCTGVPTRSLFSVDLKTGERDLLFSHPHFDSLKVYLTKEGKLEGVLFRDALLEWHFFDDEFQKEIEHIKKELGGGEVNLLSRLAGDQKWFLSQRQDNRPTAYYLFNRNTKTITLVLQEAETLLNYTFGKLEPFYFHASDGESIQGYFLRPPQGESPYPTILQVHGGPHSRDTWGFFPGAQYFALKGYASLFINYRGSFGFGKKFLMADKEEWGKRVFQDLIDGKHAAEKEGLVDPSRVAIRGGSYGGYSALLGISLTPKEFVCGVAEFPIVEPSSWMPWGYISWGFSYDKLFREAAIGAKSPLSYAHQIEVPLLMAHSENDLRVRLSQSQRMADFLDFYKIPFTYYILPGDGHGYLNPENRLFYFQELEAFLSAHIPL